MFAKKSMSGKIDWLALLLIFSENSCTLKPCLKVGWEITLTIWVKGLIQFYVSLLGEDYSYFVNCFQSPLVDMWLNLTLEARTKAMLKDGTTKPN